MSDHEDGMETVAWKFYEKYLRQSKPVKILPWTSFRGEGGTAGSFLDRRGDLVDSYDNMVASMPREALDTEITVQAKPVLRDLPPCRLCSDDFDMRVANENEATQPTNEEIVRHNLHVIDSMLSVAPYQSGSEQTLFLGQEGQLTAQRTLRDVLVERSYKAEEMNVCVAQVNIFSKEESNINAAVSKNGRIDLQGHEDLNKAPLAALLPWVRVPSFLLPTENGSIEIQSINFWMCPQECQTNTHYDSHHNILMVLHGSKTVELSPPGTARGSPVHGNHANHPFLLRCTQVGGHLDHKEFTYDVGPCGNERSACKESNIVVSVDAGEAVFIPEGWWHRIESSDDCVAINIWFDYEKSSLAFGARENNQRQLPYQAREMVRRYIDANIEDINKSRGRLLSAEIMNRIGFQIGGWRREPGKPIRQLFDKLQMGRIVPEERANEEIAIGMAIIERYGNQILGASVMEEGIIGLSHVRPLRLLALPQATKILGIMISMFISLLDADNQRDRIAMMTLFQRFSPVCTQDQRQIFTSIVKSITQGACYILSIAWEKHGSIAEAEASHTSLFNRCTGDDGRKYFMEQVDAFQNESARRLILGDLMLLNPSTGEEVKYFQAM